MENLSGVVRNLKSELARAQKEVKQFTAALAALGSVSSNGHRILSAAARRKISLAQKARWAKQRSSSVQPAKPKRTMSAAARRRIAAAQRARWANFKSQKKAA